MKITIKYVYILIYYYVKCGWSKTLNKFTVQSKFTTQLHKDALKQVNVNSEPTNSYMIPGVYGRGLGGT